MRRFELKRHVSRRIALGRRVGAPAPGDELRIAVLLHPKDAEALADAARGVSDPKSPEYGRFLSADAVRSLIAPGYQDLDAVLAWLHDAGLSPEQPSGARTVIHARGTAEAVARALDVPLGSYTFPIGMFPRAQGARYSVERNPSVPAALAPIVRGVAGLNDLPAARLFPPPIAPKRARAPAKARGDVRGPGGGYTPEAIRAAYGIPASGAEGERIAIVQFGGGFSSADFETFCAEYGLRSAGVSEVSVSGARNDFRGKAGDADAEVALDMDWVRAAAPGAEIQIYWTPNVDRGWIDVLAALIDTPEPRRPTVVSIPWGMPEDGFSTSRRYDQTRQLFLAAALLGLTFVSASGDAGAADELPEAPDFDGQRHVDFPSIVPEVTAVGGTKLLSTSRGGDHAASGGGFSRFVRVPGWQKKAIGMRRVTGRGIPDVAAVSSADPGLSIRVRKEWTAAGGTGAAAALWAGFLAHANAARAAVGRPRLGAANAALYGLAGSARSPFREARGWDPVTGLGSVDVGRLVKRLL